MYNHHHPPLYKIAKPGKRGMYGWDGRLGWTAGMDEVRSKFKVKNAKASRAENTKRIAIARTWACRQTPIDACCRVGHTVTSNGLREMAEAGERDVSQHEKDGPYFTVPCSHSESFRKRISLRLDGFCKSPERKFPIANL